MPAVPPEAMMANIDVNHAVAAAGLHLSSSSSSNAAEGQVASNEEAMPLTKSVAVQTVYRESQTQTDPFTSDYATTPGQPDPEVLSIAHLTYGNGLPAGLEEIQLIQRLREKRAFEASLSPATDEASLAVRKAKLEEREHQEWAARETEMQQEQEARLQTLIDALKAREERKALLIEERVNAVRQASEVKRELERRSILKDRLKAQRSLDQTRFQQQQQQSQQQRGVLSGTIKGNRRDIIAEAADFGSNIYAQKVRDGRMLVKNQVVDYGIPLLNNYQQLVALESTIAPPQSALREEVQSIQSPTPEEVAPKNRKTAKIAEDIEFMDRVVSGEVSLKKELKTANLYKKFEPVLRPPTPSVQAPADEQAVCAVLLLQRLLRGRAVQNAMHASKAKFTPLIQELRLAESVAPAAVAAQAAEEDAVKGRQLLEGALDSIQGYIASDALDFLSKEVVRLSEEYKITQFVAKANESRRIREAEESGRRQAEQLKRKKKEHMLHEVMQVHRDTASRFLDSLFDRSVSESAAASADMHAEVLQSALNPLVEVIEATAGAPSSSESAEDSRGGHPLAEQDAHAVVRDLLTSLVLPEVARQRMQALDDVKDRRHMVSAHAAVAVAFEEALSVQAGHARLTHPVPLPSDTHALTATSTSSSTARGMKGSEGRT